MLRRLDRAGVLSRSKIVSVLSDCVAFDGDVYDKAVVLMSGLIKQHAFASGNRRTAFVVTKYFIVQNKGKFKILDDASYAQVMQGIRENYYSSDEIKEWITNGTIKPFKRRL